MSAVFPLYYQTNQHLSIDEMMIGTRCRISFLQYLPKKPIKWEIKVWVLSEAKTGYVLSAQVYTGSENDVGRKSVAKRVVFDLLKVICNGKITHDFYILLYLLTHAMHKKHIFN